MRAKCKGHQSEDREEKKKSKTIFETKLEKRVFFENEIKKKKVGFDVCYIRSACGRQKHNRLSEIEWHAISVLCVNIYFMRENSMIFAVIIIYQPSSPQKCQTAAAALMFDEFFFSSSKK